MTCSFLNPASCGQQFQAGSECPKILCRRPLEDSENNHRLVKWDPNCLSHLPYPAFVELHCEWLSSPLGGLSGCIYNREFPHYLSSCYTPSPPRLDPKPHISSHLRNVVGVPRFWYCPVRHFFQPILLSLHNGSPRIPSHMPCFRLDIRPVSLLCHLVAVAYTSIITKCVTYLGGSAKRRLLKPAW